MSEVREDDMLSPNTVQSMWANSDPWPLESHLPIRLQDPKTLLHPPNRSPAGHWLPTSPGQLALDLAFLNEHGPGDTTIVYLDAHGSRECISNISSAVVSLASPLLYQAIEHTRSGSILTLDLLSPVTAPGFVRFLYTGSYAPVGAYDDVPTSILLHCQMYYIAVCFNLRALKTQSYVNVMRQCEFGCSSPDKPIDLCAAIAFAYQYLGDHPNVIDLILNYCVSCFNTHRLAEDEGFRTYAYNSKDFAQDLSRTVMQRGFEDDSAQAIIRLQSRPCVPETYASREDIPQRKMEDIVFRYHAYDEFDVPRKRRRCSEGAKQHGQDNVAARSICAKLAELQHTLAEQRREQNTIAAQAFQSDQLQLAVGTQEELKNDDSFPRPRAPDTTKIKEDAEEEDLMFSCESGYDMVKRPAEVEELSSSSESDSEFVRVDTVPILHRAASMGVSTARPANADSDPESDWSLL